MHGNMTNEQMNIINGMGSAGTIAFNKDGSLIQTFRDAIQSGAWDMSDKHMLIEAFADFQIKLHITKVRPDHDY
jgi:hypothetical protein